MIGQEYKTQFQREIQESHNDELISNAINSSGIKYISQFLGRYEILAIMRGNFAY